jgi:subtilisin family serine protease
VTSRLSRSIDEPTYDARQMRASRHSLAVLLGLLACLLAPATVTGAGPAGAAASVEAGNDQVLVRYRTGVSETQRGRVARQYSLNVLRTSANGRNQLVVGRNQSMATVLRLLGDDPRVEATSPNYQRELADDITDEPYFDLEWGLHNTGQTIQINPYVDPVTGIPDVDIDGLEALRITAGDPNLVVAVIDDGVDFSHPDLADRAWTNPGESGPLALPGIDDDGNGYVDDIHGWDFCNGDASVHDNGQDGHGTHVAGTIAASLNGTGVVGVAPGIRIMALKFIKTVPQGQPNPCGRDDMAAAAIDYAASFGVRVINASWGSQDRDLALESTIQDSGALFVAAAGNQTWNLDSSTYNFYPAESPQANVLSVAAIDQRGNRASFSNYGATTVDVGGPGTNIISTYPGGYAWSDGTSMAAPHVSGVAALALSVAPELTTAALKSRIMARGVTLPGLVGTTVTGKLVNAWHVADVVGPTALPVDRHGINVGSIIGSSVSTTMAWPPATDDYSGVASYVVRRRVGSGPWTILASSLTTRSYKIAIPFNTATQFGIAARDGAGNVGAQAVSPVVTAILLQDGTSLAKYAGTWSVVSSSSASNGKLHTSTRAGASVEFKTTARAMAIVGRKGPTSGRAKVYVDGVYVKTIDFYRSSAQSKVVVFSTSWSTNGYHRMKLVVLGTSGRPRVDVDAFPILR